jgi:hypothetical protein
MYINHPWLEAYPIKPTDKGIIIGTHPPMPYRGCLQFYYGNMYEFWRFLEQVYPNDSFFDKDQKPDLKRILQWLKKYELGITDMLFLTHKNNHFSVDSEIIIDDKKKQLNPFLFDWLKKSKVDTLYFTSFSNGKSAFGLFKNWYKIHFKKTLPNGLDILKDGNAYTIELFNRKVKLVMLYSPSPAARRGIPRSKPYQDWLMKNPKGNIDLFRVWWYKKYLPKSK